MTLLVVGAAGQLGREMVRVASASHLVVGLSRDDLDVTDPAAVRIAMEGPPGHQWSSTARRGPT
ncbi:MAG: hypothetical protein CM1200mP26_29860 [Acidimicrobiales bacterium]|nr:MAG: hypothetical protein CM1200mP26_29860 [Acidimicrobiales bacterium]